jgi:NDP-sugar pyrophosphorylase family protein
VRIGRHVEVGPGVRLDHTDLGDGVEVRENARLSGAACCDSSVVGPHARITDTYLGPMTEVHSERRRPVCLDGYSAVGDGARLRPGTRLSGVCVYPRLQLPDDLTGVPAGTHITSADQALQWAHPADRRSRAHLTSSRR